MRDASGRVASGAVEARVRCVAKLRGSLVADRREGLARWLAPH
jgi:hypothetical protein